MRRVLRHWCDGWGVVVFLARGVVILGTVALLLHGNTLASDETVASSSVDVFTLQFSIGEPRAMAAGDFNSDGYDDLFLVTEINPPRLVFGARGLEFLPSAGYEIRFFILPWRGEGLEEPRLISTLAAPVQLIGMSRPLTADLDGDGHQDIVVLLIERPFSASPYLDDLLENVETQLLILWNEGDLTFVQDRVPVELSLIPSENPASVALGDFNSDKLLDIVCLDPRRLRLLIFENQGERNFAEPIPVPLARSDDECIPVAINVQAAWVDETRPGDNIIVSGPCYYAEGRFTHFVRVLFPCGTDCWQASPLLLADVQMPDFTDALWDIALRDINGDGHADIVVLGLLHVTDARPLLPGTEVPLMDIYLLPGDGRGQFGPPQFLGWSEKGVFLFVELQPEREWSVAIVVLAKTDIRSRANAVLISRDFSRMDLTTLGGRGYVVDGAVIKQGTGRELVLLASLDFESGVTLVNVIRGWWR